MTYATVCSGIGAPEAAWADMWGSPEFTAEIEAFPSAVLKHHYPDVPNYGDMTKYKEWPDHELDVLIGGTPCQSFSVAGLRGSLQDDRGNLTITFLGLVRKYQPRFTVWENVPGVLNTPDNAFGQFLSGLAGFDSELRPTGGRWSNAGFIVGPDRVAAWRILNAEFFGVPQRRRRVFVVASPGDMGFAPCSILFEPQGMPRDIKKVSGRVLFCCDTGITSYDRSAKDNILIDTANNTVRLLTPREVERAYGFPDDFTLIPWRKGQAPDGPRYKALGNSMAVPVVRWIGRRIQLWEDLK